MSGQPARVWYVAVQGERRGPYSSEAIGRFLKEKKLDMHHLCWRPGLADWVSIGEASNVQVKAVPPGERVSPPPVPGAAPTASSRKSRVLWLAVAVVFVAICAAVAWLSATRRQVPSLSEAPVSPASTATSVEAQVFPLEDYVPLGSGYVWIYEVKRGDATSEEECRCTKYSQESPGKMRWAVLDGDVVTRGYRTGAGDRIMQQGPRSYAPEIALFDDPMELGSFLQTATHVRGRKNDYDVTVTSNVDCLIDVTVPAGTFANCVQTSYHVKGAQAPEGLGRLASQSWYAKGAGLVKRVFYDPGKQPSEERSLIRALIDGQTVSGE